MLIDWIVVILTGALIGWLASLVMKTDSSMGMLANILVGIVGSLLGRWLFADVLGIGSASAAGTFTLLGVLWGVVGAVILLAILRLFMPKR
jgi:uncharacterized membrane protein YeaQ/YmgE (transglycosylase-associated protein family)